MGTDLNDEAKQHEEDLERIANFRLMDDDYMTAFFNKYPEGVELMLRIIMNKPGLAVRDVKTQNVLKNLHGRSITLDVDASDTDGTEYNVEIQRSDAGADPKRARFHGGMKDMDVLKPGDDFSDLPETYIIFITENDVIGENERLYVIDRYINGTERRFDDGLHILYVNSEIQDETDLGRLMHDFYCKRPEEMHYRELRERAHYFKETEEGVTAMCKAMEDMRKETAHQIMVRNAREMLSDSRFSHEDVARFSGLTLDEVKELAGEKSA
ncbi:MAG: PD-(D/E)XK nuclease family transposase [Lachnospiraceae bacterium]|nr:PD-(D/E)XK nuclease family transposase [Lachnospiraceae bacterium]